MKVTRIIAWGPGGGGQQKLKKPVIQIFRLNLVQQEDSMILSLKIKSNINLFSALISKTLRHYII